MCVLSGLRSLPQEPGNRAPRRVEHPDLHLSVRMEWGAQAWEGAAGRMRNQEVKGCGGRGCQICIPLQLIFLSLGILLIAKVTHTHGRNLVEDRKHTVMYIIPILTT